MTVDVPVLLAVPAGAAIGLAIRQYAHRRDLAIDRRHADMVAALRQLCAGVDMPDRSEVLDGR
jgi:hypothetical protein